MIWKWNKQHSTSRWSPSQHLISLNKRDHLTLGDAFENILILGAVGSGKTSGSGFAICKAMLELGLGGMFLTVKRGDAERIRRLCSLTGRSSDLIVIDDMHEWQFNFFQNQLELVGRNGGGIENLVATLDAIMKVAGRATGKQPGHGTEEFFEHGIRKHGRAIITLIVHATGSISVEHILEIMREIPRSQAQAESPDWRNNSTIVHLLAIARNKASNQSTLHDLDQVEQYFFRDFVNTAEKTRSSFEAGLYGILDLLTRGSLYWTFGRGTNVSPMLCGEGKILVIDWPITTHGAVGLIAQTMFKLGFQLFVQQRSGVDCRPMFLVADEFQALVTESDYQHAAISRESRVVNLWMTQTIASLHAALGSSDAGRAACDALLGLANYKIFHANGDPITNNWAAELIGRRFLRTRSLSVHHQPYQLLQLIREEPAVTMSSNESVEYAVLPHVFTSLMRGGSHLKTEALVFGSGRRWKSTNETYLKVVFNQGF